MPEVWTYDIPSRHLIPCSDKFVQVFILLCCIVKFIYFDSINSTKLWFFLRTSKFLYKISGQRTCSILWDETDCCGCRHPRYASWRNQRGNQTCQGVKVMKAYVVQLSWRHRIICIYLHWPSPFRWLTLGRCGLSIDNKWFFISQVRETVNMWHNVWHWPQKKIAFQLMFQFWTLIIIFTA